MNFYKMRIKKVLILLIISLVIFANFSIVLAAPDSRDWTSWVTEDDILKDNAVGSAEVAILIDANSGKILFTKSAYNSMNPASTTKIMTALLTIENLEMDTVVTISDEISAVINELDPQSTRWSDGKTFLENGEQVTVKELLYGLMLNSGNDAAVALAFTVGGTYENFITMMNSKASEIDMFSTSYTNPHGLTDEGHKTTARDMALLAMYAKQYPEFEKLVSTVTYKPADTNKRSFSELGDAGIWKNSNKLINGDATFGYQYATGIKTGFTDAAQSCLVSSALNGDQSLVAVVMHDTGEGKWTNSKTLFEYGYDFYETLDVSTLFLQSELTAEIDKANPSVSDGQLTMSFGEAETVYLTEFEDIIENIKTNPSEYFVEEIIYTNGALVAPVQQGEQVGIVTYKYQYSHNSDDYLGYKATEGDVQEIVFTAPLIANETIEAEITTTPVPATTPSPTKKPNDSSIFGSMDVAKIALYAIIVLFVVLIILLIMLAISRRSPNNRYSNGSSGGDSARHSHDNRGGSTKRRRH